MNKLMLTTGCLSLLVTSACANFSPLVSTRSIPADGAHLITYDSSRRGTLITVAGGRVTAACAEPAPDTAYGFSNGFKVGGKGGKTPAEVSADIALTATVSALAGRDNLVLMTREAMFRLCEAKANNFFGDPAYASAFGEILKQINAIADVKKAQSTADSQRLDKTLDASLISQMLGAVAPRSRSDD